MAILRGRKVKGTAYSDTIYGLTSDDQLNGNGGNDTIYGGNGRDIISGGDHNDALFGDAGDDAIYGDAGNDRLYGGDGNDMLSGGLGNDSLYGGANDDILRPGAGANVVDGGSGIDTVDYSTGLTKGVSVFLQQGLGGVTGSKPMQLSSIERVIGSVFADEIVGSSADDWIRGGGGRDTLWGLSGDDTVDGGDSGDWLSGGAGNDLIRPGDMSSNTSLGGTGYDTVDYSGTAVALSLEIDAVRGEITDKVSEHIDGVECIIGTAFADEFRSINIDIKAGAGEDSIFQANAANVVIDLGADDDYGEFSGDGVTIICGEGRDWIKLDDPALGMPATSQTVQLQYDKGYDNIWDVYGEDHLRVSLSEFGIGGTTAAPEVEFLHITGDDGDPTPVNNIATFMAVQGAFGMIWFDRDGTGVEYAPVAIASIVTAAYYPNYGDLFEFVA